MGVEWPDRREDVLNAIEAKIGRLAAYCDLPPTFEAFLHAILALRQKLLGERGTLTLRLTDPFETAGFRVEAGDEEVLQITERSFNARARYTGR